MLRLNVLTRCLALSLLLVACSDSQDSSRVVQSGPQVAFDDAPTYARACTAASDGEIVAVASYKDTSVNVRVLGSQPLQETTITLSSCPQGVVVGTDGTGAKFLLVSTVDFATHESKLVWFVDTDADNLPDSASETLIEDVSDAHVVSLTYSQDDVVLYALDAKNDLVYRYVDTSGDNIPDAASRSTMVEAGGVLGTNVNARDIVGASVDSVVVIPTMDSQPDTMYERIHTPTGAYLDLKHTLTDTNADGVADAIVSDPLLGFHERVYSVLSHGDDAVRIKAADGTSYSVAAESTTGVQTILATFVGDGLIQEVTLSRDLDGDETLVLIRDSDSAELAREPVRDAGATYVDARIGSDAVIEGGTEKFSGVNLTGTETVEVRLRKAGEAWTTATVTAFSSEELTVAVPDLGLDPDEIDTIEFRISDGTTELFYRSTYVRGQ